MTIIVREIPYELVAPWRSAAARDKVALGETANTTWFGAYIGDELVGVAGTIRVGKVARLKGAYVPLKHRGKGIGTELTAARIKAAPAELDIETLSYHPAFYQGRGFVEVGQYRPGVTRLIFARSRPG